MVDRLVESACRVDYPRELLDIQLLDDSTDETIEVSRACVDRLAALGHPVTLIQRTNRHGFKAGALEEGMRTAKGEFIAIFDADFVIPADFLQRTVHYFTDPAIGMLQTRWTFMNRDYSFLTRVQSILLDGHFVLEHGARARSGCFFNFNGTAGIWRRVAIADGGGWQHDTLTEDTDLSYRAQMAGWKFLYLPDVECPSELPVEINAFKTQQARWAKGLIQTSLKILPRLFKSKAPLHYKIEAWFHLTANISYLFMIVLSVLLLPAMIVRFYQGWFQMLYIDLPLFMASTFSISSFYLTSQRELRPKDWLRTFKYLPFLMAVGIGIGVSNSRAVFEALLGVHSPFQRTAKYRIDANNRVERPKAYRRKGGWIPAAELAIGTFFLGTIVYSIESYNFATVPFLAIFVMGYYYIGLMSMFQDTLENLASRFPMKKTAATTLLLLVLASTTSLHAIEREPLEVYKQRRADLARNLNGGIAVIFAGTENEAGDAIWGFRQDDYFYYLTGLPEPGGVLVLQGTREILFMPPRDKRQERWTGPKIGPEDEGIAAKVGVAKVMAMPALDAELRALLVASNVLYTVLPAHGDQLRALAPFAEVRDAKPAINRLRPVKSPSEQALLQKAADCSVAAHRAAMQAVKPGVMEYEIAGLMGYIEAKNGCLRPAYAPIVGSGFNSTVLHYSANEKRMEAGETVVIDVAGEYSGYAADITRTLPVNGKFTERQREIYDIVLGAQKAAIAAIKPGVELSALTKIATEYINSHGKDMQGNTLGRYFIHGLGHSVGLNVHDPNPIGPLQAGVIITMEPGIYIPEEKLGVRIEDMVLVTDTGSRVITGALPREASEVEKAMRP